MARGIFYLVAGPAGVGKTTLLNRLLAEETGLIKAVSVTTRKPRPGEVDGKAYFFWDEARFVAAVEQGEFIEHAVVHGHHYGTPKKFIEEKLNAGVDVIKDIDVQGFAQIRWLKEYQYPRSVGIFVLPPSWEELVERLKGRGSEAEESLQIRIRNAGEEMRHVGEYDYQVVNGSVDHGLTELKAIRLAERCRVEQHP